ncbi:MAG TPA: hybrid sensor histidine kinase/response regulator [Melioribacteraceae bacterium]|nr:hybrid sensor histidine kinase/response regulator [Melioribacteraceae bacterium]
MNPVKKDAAYCFGNLRDGLTFISNKFKHLFNEEIIKTLNQKLINNYSIDSSFKLNNYSFSFYLLSDNQFLLLFEDDLNTKSVIHDLNNILNNINNAILLAKRENNRVNDNIFDGINNNIKRAQYLLRKLTFNDDEEIKLVDEINIINTLNLVYEEIKNLCGDRIIIKRDFPNIPLFIVANEEEIFRVFYNICLNSVESIVNSGTITITLQKAKGFINICIVDTGAGIDDKNIDKIFDFGFSTKKKRTESGIGLSIVKNIIEQYKGKIKVNSIVNKGTTFTVSFPEVNSTDVLSAEDCNILLVDDDEFMLDLLTELFSSYNYKITTAKNGEELINIATTDNIFSLIIVDQNMPGIKGLDAIKTLRNKGNNSQIILCSGTTLNNSTDILKKLNIADVVTKPYDFEYLLNKVKSIVSSK